MEKINLNASDVPAQQASAEPIRVLQVFARLNRGGAESMLMSLYRSMDKSKVQFDFVANKTTDKYAFQQEITEMGGRIYYVPRYKIYNHFPYQRAWRKLLANHPEWHIIHAHHTVPALIYFKAAKKYGIMTIAHSHSANRNKSLKERLRVYFCGKMVAISDRKLACSREAGKWMFGQHNFVVLNNGINISRYIFNAAEREAVRQSLQLEDCQLVGHFGRFFKPKNHAFLIDIFAEMYKLNKKVRLLLFGSGPLKHKIMRKVNRLGLADAVLFMGVRDDVPKFIQALDIFVFPSRFEGVPVTLIEAQAGGLPCLVSENVTRETKITDGVVFMPLAESAATWAEKALQMMQRHERKDTSREIVKAGYDAFRNSIWLQEYYQQIDQERSDR